ncbi:fos-related antigen 2 [Rhinichthys klamathensis goyatoka]|uniref:fos-related antigen 2 n=1 Tax=Rhinichthys klamathensis goyatoka TaxID=3034132 RepID=UPI0024B57449|nr:fos-related antigen 2 [Rhinichthys klamathensis goyatoka]
MPVAPLIELKEKWMGGTGISTPGLIKLNLGKSLIALTFLFNVSVSKWGKIPFRLEISGMELSDLAIERNCISGGEISNSIRHIEMQVSKSPFISTVNAVTSRQELRWIIEPVMASERLDQSRESTTTDKRNVQLSPEEEEKRRRRRERNKMAAAKCRNRRRELIDLLQEETERLHMEQVLLQRQVSFLQQEKEQLKMLLASHASTCTLAQDKPPSLDTFLSRELLPSRISIAIKREPLDDVSGSESLALQNADIQN